MKKKQTHSDHCNKICIVCLKKTKSFKTIVPKRQSTAPTDTEKCVEFRVLSQLKLKSPDLNYLPKIICTACRLHVLDPNINADDFPVIVDYQGFIENVKSHLNSEGECDGECEMCTIGSASLHPDPSKFLLVERKTVGQPAIQKQPKITEFFQMKKNATEQEKLKKVVEIVPNDSMEQLFNTYLDTIEPDSDGNAYLKRVHGPKRKIVIEKVKPSKTVISHKTLFRIKRVCNESGNQITKIARILNKNSDVKIESNFEDALYEQGHACKDFFQSKVLEMEVYEEQDFKLWSFTKEGNLVDRAGQLPLKDKVYNIPEEGKKGHIEEVATKKVLSLKSGNNSEVILKKKKTPKKVTRSSASNKNVPSDDQIWIRGHSNVHGWFILTHVQSGKLLTSSTSDKVTAEELEKYLQS